LFRAIAWRIAWRNELLIYRAGPLALGEALPPPPPSPEISLIHIRSAQGQNLQPIETAMRLAGEETDVIAPRLARGDEFFGWRTNDNAIVSFGWVTRRNRRVGLANLKEAEGRAFVYNFHTLPAYRGRGLYPRLLQQMRYVLIKNQEMEFIIDVNVRNLASKRGIEKSGFDLVARTSYVTLFRRWSFQLRAAMLSDCASSLFKASG
jgi:hypothetical protein